MIYDVFLDGDTLYGISGVALSSARDINTYNGIGRGKFALADSKDLKQWTIKCELTENNDHRLEGWQPAQDVFAKLERLLNTQTASRLIISTEHDQTSERVLLKGYDKQEVYSGVFDVTISFIEDVPVSIRTTDVPYIERPGKIPIPPTVVFDDKVTPFAIEHKYKGKQANTRDQPFYNPLPNPMRGFYDPTTEKIHNDPWFGYADTRTGKMYDNPLTIPKHTEVVLKELQSNLSALYGAGEANTHLIAERSSDYLKGKYLNLAYREISTAYSDYDKLQDILRSQSGS